MNKTEVTKVFEEYVVDETAEAADGYAGIITGVKVEKSLASNGVISYNDYTIAANVLVDENGELKQYKKYYRNILTRGRNNFQNLISDFELIKEEDGNTELRLDLLLGRICEVTFGMTNCIKNITIPDFEDEETKDEITAILKKEADIADGVDVPDKIKNYTIIPVVDQADGFSINTKYTAVIKKIDCFKDKAHPDDVTIRVSAYLYNGGTTEKYCKYFNCVHSKGKEEFDEFCKVFDSINETGKINTDKIIGRLCEAELAARKIKFITTLSPKGSPNAAIMEQYDDIIRMCTLISNDRKEYNQLDFDAFFKSYVVNDTSDNWKNYPACLTDAKIYRSKGIEGDFNLKIKVNVILKNKLKSAHQIYKNVLTTGRRAFQEFAEEFELWTEDEEGIKCLDLSRLDNKVCIAKVNKTNQLKGITNILLDGSAKENEIIDFFKKHIKAAHNINLATVPDEVMYYQYIPVTTSEDEYMPNIEYHGCIRDVECEEVGDDINVKIAAYVFDGGKTRVITKFFNSIKTNGKSEFDRFCKMYDIVDNEGRIQIEKIKGRFSKVVLWENRKGNKYIDSLEPLSVKYDVHNNQYRMLIKEYLNSHKTKRKD